MDIENLVQGLTRSDNKFAYQCLLQLEAESKNSAAVYKYFDTFSEMLTNANSYIRARGIILIAANAKWDADNKIDEIIDEYLKHITDDKPITARQCIKVLPSLVQYKPDLKDTVVDALHSANPSRYNDNMQPLVLKDIQNALKVICYK